MAFSRPSTWPVTGPGHPPELTLGTPCSHSALRPTHLETGKAHPALGLPARPRVRQRSLTVRSVGPRAAERPAGVRESEGCPGLRLAWPPSRQSLSTATRGTPGDRRDAHFLRALAGAGAGGPCSRVPPPLKRGREPRPLGLPDHVARSAPASWSRDSSTLLPWQRLRRSAGVGQPVEAGLGGDPAGLAEGGRGPRLAPGPGHKATWPR